MERRTWRSLAAATLLASSVATIGGAQTAVGAPTVHYVDVAHVGGAEDGSSWSDPYHDLTSALAAASTGDEIWIAQGTYVPGANRTDTFALVDGVSLLGGFANGDLLLDRDPASKQTILSGEIGVAGDPTDNSYNVVAATAGVSTATLDGVTIADGNADGATPQTFHGGGVYVDAGLVTLRDVVVRDNDASVGGPGVTVRGTSGAAVEIVDSRIRDNDGPFAALFVDVGESMAIRDAELSGNGGGAVLAQGTLEVVGTSIIDNGGTSSGGAVGISGATASIVNTTIMGNLGGPGAGMSVRPRSGPFGSDAEVDLANVLIANNHTSATNGGGLYLAGSTNGGIDRYVTVEATNVTLAENASVFCCPNSGGDEIFASTELNLAGTDPLVSAGFDNSIVWNTRELAPGIPSLPFLPSDRLPIAWRNSLVVTSGGSGAGWNTDLGGDGGGNIDDDPDFLFPGLGIRTDTNYRLLADSPALGAGANAFLPSDVLDVDGDLDTVETLPLDLDGEARIQGPTVDMGAFEGGDFLCAGEVVTVRIALGETPTESRDVILGTDGPDVIDGLGGNDVICGLDGDDVIDGGPGLDTIFGDGGVDDLEGGQGNDTIYGGAEGDTIYGTGGGDHLFGEGGDDVIRGGNGNDTIEGGPGADELRGQNGEDEIWANSAADSSTTDVDEMYGGGLFDDLTGDNGDDLMYGGNNADVLAGKGGDDDLFGNNGADTLRGGPHLTGDDCNGGAINSSTGDTANACETIVNVP